MEWLVLGFVNLIVAFLNLCIQIARGKTRYGVVVSLTILCCPIVSVAVLLVAWVVQMIAFRGGSEKLNMEELSFKKERIQLVVPANVQQEIQKVPVEEALLVSDKFSKRETILNVLKEDYSASLPVLRKAVDDWDSEIAHYAATTITDVIEKFKNEESKLRESCEEERSPEKITEYIFYVEDFLEKKLLPEFEFKKYLENIKDYMYLLKEKYYEYFNSTICNKLVQLLMECKEFEEAEEWIDFLFANYNEDLATYKSGLRFYFVQEENEKFMELLEKLKQSTLVLDAETLEWVRFCQ